jgi:hypothetical protein
MPLKMSVKFGAVAMLVLVSIIFADWLRHRHNAPKLQQPNVERALKNNISFLKWGEFNPKTGEFSDFLSRTTLSNENGEAISSWRFGTTRSMGEDEEFGLPTLALPWNHPENAWIRERAHNQYCYSDQAWDGRYTNCMAVTGRGTAFDDHQRRRMDELGANTILLIEVEQAETHWMEPGDVTPEDIRTMLTEPVPKRHLGTHPPGFHVGFSDGQVLRLSHKIPYEVLEPFLFVDRAQERNREKELEPYALRDSGP